MPTKTEITLYEYSELSETAKDAAKHNVGDHWWEQLHEDERTEAGEHLKAAGLPFDPELTSGNLLEMFIDTSCTQGSGMSVTGKFDFSEVDECEPLVDIVTDYPQFDPASLTVMITHNTHHYVHEYTMDVEVEFTGDAIMVDLDQLTVDDLIENGGFEERIERPLVEIANRVTDVLQRLCREAHAKALEVTLSDSDGYIDEWMDSNGYWFDEDGQIIRRDDD